MSRFKKITGAVVAMALIIMTTIVTFAFKADVGENTKGKRVFADAWYFINNSTNPATQTISGAPEGTLEGTCQQNNDGDICAIQLSFEGTPPNLNGVTVEDAVDDHGATVVLVGGNPVYARHPEAR